MDFTGDPISYFQKLFNEHVGMPVSNPGTITAADNQTITIKTEKVQIVSLFCERETIIQSNLTASTIHAKLQSIDFKETQAVLAYFDFPKRFIGARSQIRVEPEVPIPAGVLTSDSRYPFSVQLADVSQDGLGVFAREPIFNPATYLIQAPVTILLPSSVCLHGSNGFKRTSVTWSRADDLANRKSSDTLRMNPLGSGYGEISHLDSSSITPEKSLYGKELELRGTIANIQKDTISERFRVGIRLSRSNPGKAYLNQFITRRQNEIRSTYSLLAAINKPESTPGQPQL